MARAKTVYMIDNANGPEADFFGRNPYKSLKSFPPCYLQSPLPPLEQKWFETGCNVNIVCENLKPEIYQDYAQKPQ
jgi:hypothetical protein